MRRIRDDRGASSDLVGVVALALAVVVTAALCVVAYKHAHPSATVRDTALPPNLVTSSQPADPTPAPSATATAIPAGPTLPPSGAVNTLWVGDTLLQGAGASDQAHDYLSLVTKALKRSGRQPATTTSTLPLSQVNALEAAVTRAAPDDLVVVGLGSAGVGTVPVSTFKSEYRRVVIAATTGSPKAVLVCLGVYADPKAAAPYDAQIKTSCTQDGGRFVTLSDLYDAKGPTDRVHAQVADRIVAQLDLSQS